jgi:hypothetical protein
MKNSPAFSTFRDLLDIWDENLKLEKIKTMIDGNLVLFFNKDNEYFGCPEESRLVFAKIKSPDEDDAASWADEAGFLALNLSRALEGEDEEPPKKLFYKKDLDDIKIMDKEELEKILFKKDKK